MLTLDYFNSRLNDLFAHSKMLENQLQASYGHIREVQHLMKELAKSLEGDKEHGETDSEDAQQAA